MKARSEKNTTYYLIINTKLFIFNFPAINELQTINPIPQIEVIKSIFSWKKKTRIVGKISFVKSNGIKFVSLDRLIAFVQSNSLRLLLQQVRTIVLE